MFVQTNLALMSQALDAFGLGASIKDAKKALIKINMARLPTEKQPRTDLALLKKTIEYIAKQDADCVLTEGANGHLYDQLIQIGMKTDLIKYDVKVIDLDIEDAYKVIVDSQEHHIPKFFNDYRIRVALPCASKRENMLFSNNVKLFVGAVPRRFYQDDPCEIWRSKIHKDLDKSVAAVYKSIMENVPFCCFINGGKAYKEGIGNFEMDTVFIGNDALELDNYMIENIFQIDKPEYIKILIKK